MLTAGDEQDISLPPLAVYAGQLRGLSGHVDVARALQGRGGYQGGVPVQQGQGEQEPGEELAGDVAASRYSPGVSRPRTVRTPSLCSKKMPFSRNRSK
jgi:hypothetical protein